MVVDTACSSSLTALYLAGRALRAGEIDAALVGGVNLSIHPNKYLALGAGQFLSSKGRCEAFGEGADGYVPGEGVGVLLLKRLDDAVRDGDHVYGVIKGTAIGHGGKTSGFTVPSPQAQHIVIAAALEEAGIEPRTVSYVEAHGTGTKLGDPIEIAGLAAAFEQVTDERQFCAVGSVKPNIGHCEAAAGIAGITKVLLQMQHREIVPSLHSRPPNPHIDLASTAFYVNDELRHWPRPLRDGREAPRRAGVSSFGAGGSNAHVVIEEHSGEPAAADVRPALIPLSAKSEEQLRAYAQELVSFLQRSRERRGVEPVARPCARRVQDVLIEAAARLLNLPADQIVPTGNLAAQGFDAVALAHLMQDVEQSFDLTLDPSLFYQQPSLAALASELCHSHGAALDARLTDDDGSNSAPDFPSLEDIAYTLQVGRVAFSERLAVVVSDIDQLEKQLQQFLDETPSPFAYRGSVKSGEAERSRQLVEGEVGAEFIAAVARSRQLNKLAHLWVTGVAVDWALLYPERHPVRVSLPTYPFARQRYWIADVLGSPTAQPAPHSTDESESPDSPLSRPAWGPLQREDSSQHVMLAASDGNGSPSAAQPAQSVAASGGAAGSLNGRQAPSGNGAAAPRNEFEAKIADAWQEVLGLPHVGIRDNFLELGGSSLGVTQIISRLRKAFPFELDLSNFFGAATVAEMAEMLEEEIIRRIRELPGEDITGAIDDATGAGARPRE
jgi:acyl transferase domain-containing protein